MAVIVIFVEGADTEPDPLPVYILDNVEHAARICDGIGATKYRAYKFSFCEVGKADQSKFPFWAEMTIDARDGIYGDNVAGIYDMIDRAYAIISQRRSRVKAASTTDAETNNSTKQAEADRRSIEEIERNTPKLDTQSMEWIAARKENEEKLGYPTSTLSKYRLESLGGRQLSEYFGIDKDGRRWRRAENMTQGSTVYYYANDLKKYGKKA